MTTLQENAAGEVPNDVAETVNVTNQELSFGLEFGLVHSLVFGVLVSVCRKYLHFTKSTL